MTGLKICSINVTSLVKIDRQIEIGRYVAKHNFDICLIQETRLGSKWVEKAKGYNVYRNNDKVGTFSATVVKIEGRQMCSISLYPM